MGRNTLHGLPTAITPAGIFLVTTLPAPTILPSPTSTPPQIVTLAPSQASRPMVIGAEVPTPVARCLASIACPAHARQVPGPIKVFSPICTGDVSRITQL